MHMLLFEIWTINGIFHSRYLDKFKSSTSEQYKPYNKNRANAATLADASGIDRNSEPISDTFEQNEHELSHPGKRARNVTRAKTDIKII